MEDVSRLLVEFIVLCLHYFIYIVSFQLNVFIFFVFILFNTLNTELDIGFVVKFGRLSLSGRIFVGLRWYNFAGALENQVTLYLVHRHHR